MYLLHLHGIYTIIFGNLSEFLQSYIVYKFYEANKMWMWHNRQNLNIYANNFKTVFNAVCVAVLAESLYLALIVDHFHATFSFLTNIFYVDIARLWS